MNRVMSRKIGFEWIDNIWNVIESRRMEKEKKTEQKRIETGRKVKDHILNRVMARKISYEWMDNIWEVIDSRRMERKRKTAQHTNFEIVTPRKRKLENSPEEHTKRKRGRGGW